MYSAYQLENQHIIEMKWIMKTKYSHICDIRRNYDKFPYHRYPKEIAATLSLISYQILITIESLINATKSNH